MIFGQQKPSEPSKEPPKPEESPEEEVVDREWQKVYEWRMHVLVKAGYVVDDAQALAGRGDIDLHLAAELPSRGCPRPLALDILL